MKDATFLATGTKTRFKGRRLPLLLMMVLALAITTVWNMQRGSSNTAGFTGSGHVTTPSRLQQKGGMNTVELSGEDCSAYMSCVQCALRYFSSNCVWLADESRCLDAASAQPMGHDIEAGYCSLILVAPVETNHKVIYVGKRTGGPEALIQLFLALQHWGFRASLHTRKKQVGGKLLPFFLKSYKAEFDKLFGSSKQFFFQHSDYAAFLASAQPGDTVILTETWPCQRHLLFSSPRQVRQVQYILTVQDRRLTYDVSHFYIKDAHPEACGVFVHTHFLAQQYLNTSRKGVVPPYISPHIHQHAQHQFTASAPRHMVLVDGDAGFNPTRDFPARLQPHIRKAASIKPEELYSLMKKAALTIDFAMPGAERLVMEAALLGSRIAINDELNGASKEDFPIPEQYRVRGRNITQLIELIDHALHIAKDPTAATPDDDFTTFGAYVRQLKTGMHRAVRQYFSDSIHFVINDDGRLPLDAQRTEALLGAQLLSILLHLPNALVTVTLTQPASKNLTKLRQFLDAHYLSASVAFTTATPVRSPARPSSAWTASPDRKEAITAAMPGGVGSSFIASPNAVGYLAVLCAESLSKDTPCFRENGTLVDRFPQTKRSESHRLHQTYLDGVRQNVGVVVSSIDELLTVASCRSCFLGGSSVWQQFVAMFGAHFS